MSWIPFPSARSVPGIGLLAPVRLSMRAEFAAACALRDRGMELARNIFEEKRDLFPRTELTGMGSGGYSQPASQQGCAAQSVQAALR